MKATIRTSARVGAAILLIGASLCATAQTPASGAAHVKQFLERENAGPDRQVNVEVDTSGQDLSSCLDRTPELPGRSKRTTGPIAVRLSCDDPERPNRYVHANVSITGPFFVAAAPIDAGQRVQAAAIEQRRGDITDQIDELAPSEDDLVGLQARRRIRKDTPLTRAMFEPADLIKRGDTVTVLVSAGSYRVETHGQALTPAPEGETVRVRTDNGTIIKGQVRHDGTVHLTP